MGARGYLTKPFTSEQLIETMSRITQHLETKKKQSDMVALLRRQRDIFMKELALEYVRQKRTDKKAMLVLEQVAADPHCDHRWLVALGKIYVQRREWGKLKRLRQRVEAGGQAG